ncbi:MAG: M14 family metallopeptidase [Acidobacteria bacterium]|nr:M14 family metallopeptidase [Acidobacteriota bacterium]
MHTPIRSIAITVAIAMLAAATGRAQAPSSLEALRTRAERTGFVETSRYDDVMHFLRVVDEASPLVHLTSFGYTFEGRSLPLAIVGRVTAATPEAVRASGKLRVYIQANVHGGEVEGKEAMQALVRDIARGQHAAWLDSMVLLIAPIYNADGNDRITLTNRGPQHGPIGGSGTRANAQNLNINRDYIKLETPEARSMVKLLNDFDPHVMLDLHTTNGSYHAYHLTYETPNNPAVDAAIIERMAGPWMKAVSDGVRAKNKWEFRAYGNVGGQAPERRWTTVEDLPRYSHNYWGLRNRLGILSEVYSYLPFDERVTVNARFVEEVLAYAHANAAALQRLTTEADARNVIGQRLSLRSQPARSPEMVDILMGGVEEEINPYSGRVMLRRTDVRRPERMWEYARFESTEQERVPSAYYIPSSLTAVVTRLRTHGIRLERVAAEQRLPLEQFTIEKSDFTAREFEGHRERTTTGRYAAVEETIAAGAWRVDMTQPLARLAFYLLEPRSNDALLSWNVLDDALKDSTAYPILRTRN